MSSRGYAIVFWFVCLCYVQFHYFHSNVNWWFKVWFFFFHTNMFWKCRCLLQSWNWPAANIDTGKYSTFWKCTECFYFLFARDFLSIFLEGCRRSELRWSRNWIESGRLGYTHAFIWMWIETLETINEQMPLKDHMQSDPDCVIMHEVGKL